MHEIDNDQSEMDQDWRRKQGKQGNQKWTLAKKAVCLGKSR